MNNWDDLLNAAIIGTQNSGTSQTDDRQSAEQLLLKQLALEALKRRAGYVNTSGKPHLETDKPSPEVLPKCSAVAMEWLRKVAEAPSLHVFVRDWCLLIASRQKRIPHKDLHYVLNLSNKSTDWIPYLIPVIGERGKWLVHRSDTYPRLKQPEFWDAAPDAEKPQLQPTPIDPSNTFHINLREQMQKDLANE